VVPAVLSWEGSLLVTSVKDDVIHLTVAVRENRSMVVVLGGSKGPYRRFWDPMLACDSSTGAREMALLMIQNTPAFQGSSGDARFWYHLGEPLLAGICRIACHYGGSRVLVEILRTQTLGEVAELLVELGEEGMAAAVVALDHDDPRHTSSILLTLTQVVQPYCDAVEALGHDDPFDLRDLWGAPRSQTQPFSLYLCAPFHLQRRISPYLSTLVSSFAKLAMSEIVESRAEAPTLMVLDEAANIAPVSELAELASIGTDLGLQLISVFQDVNQVERVYAQHAGTLINNHRAKLFLSSVSDPTTMHLLDEFLGRGDAETRPRFEGSAPGGRIDWRRVPYGSAWLIEGSASARYVRVDRGPKRWLKVRR
jgi:type IV secretion system protein VirD4